MRRSGTAAMLGAWAAQAHGDAAGGSRMQPASDHGDHRTQVDVVGRALHQARRSSAARARGDQDAEGRARTKSTQQRNPSLPNSEKAVMDQLDILLVASPAGFEPATCGLEIRCCYPAELRGRVVIQVVSTFARRPKRENWHPIGTGPGR